MTLRNLLKWYLIMMMTSIFLMVISLFILGFLLLIMTFIVSSVHYFKVKCIKCGEGMGVFGERLAFRTLTTDKCSVCLKSEKE